ncbi:hypothetical protein [Nannocystis punicea]|uniref:Glycosyl transferase family 2 n=1 Tax=Nannocystis punicea TaxID=2995304 RepID=A0ABY7GV20_9BACT|nr:hypothetical protein [Nannocystis poenicansa]WAS90788.1 hypothetical protein O0S08_31760 [Nannocystis poenicansa]
MTLDPTPVRCCDVVCRDLALDNVLVYGVHSREARVVARAAAEALLAARRFRPLAEHIDLATRGCPAEEAANIQSGLLALAEAGMFVSFADLRRVCVRDDEPPPIDLVAIPSAERPAAAERAVASLIADAERFSRPREHLVADGSADPATRADYRQRLAALARAHAARVVYIGDDERRDFIARLAARGHDPGLVAFALADPERTGMAYGTGRNALLLHAVGRRFVCIDDDVIARPVRPPDPLPGLGVFTGEGEGYDNYQPQDIWFYPDRAAALADARWSDDEALGGHAGMLGRSLPALLAAVPAGEPIELDDCLDRALLRRLRTGQGRVRVTFQGLLGDLGWYAPTWCLLFEGKNRERLLAAEDTYRRTITSTRQALRLVRRATVGDGRYCQGAILGLDHRDLLPPFFPVGRYEDGVFRTTLRALDETALFGHVPSALVHEPVQERAWAEGDIWRPGGWARLGELVVQCVRAAASPTTPAALGQHLRELGRLSPADFRAFVAQRLWRQKELYARHLETLLARHRGAPSWWRDDVHRHLGALAEHAATREYPAPRDLLGERGDPDLALARAQRLVARFGELLVAWPDLVRTTAELARAGHPLGVPLA